MVVVDDEVHIRESLSQYLSDVAHYRTITFAEGIETLEWLKNHTCDLLIIDIKMPGINGIDTIKEIKKFKSGQKIMIFTGSRFQNIPEISQELDIPEEYIVIKPLSTMEIFLDRVDKILKN